MPSYRRNRDYSSQFKWTEELKQDVFRCYKEAKSDPKIGYMKRMKKLWDNIHPELNYFSDKNLRDIASRVEKEHIVMETEYNNANINDKSLTDNNDITNNSQDNEVQQSINDGVITENNTSYHSEIPVYTPETDPFTKELKNLFMNNIINTPSQRFLILRKLFFVFLNQKHTPKEITNQRIREIKKMI